MAPIWHSFASSSYVPSISNISVYSDANRNDVYSRTPDFSEFKDPWEEYSPQNDSFPTDNSSVLNDKNDNYYGGAGYEKEAADVGQNDHNTSQFERNQQFHYEQYSYVPIQIQHSSHSTNEHNQHREHVTSHSEENHSQRQHTEYHWQQYSDQRHQFQPSEQRHYPEQHEEQKQHNEQYQQHHHEERQHEPRHYNEQKQHSEYHQHSGQSQQHDYYKMDAHHVHQSVHEQHSTETWHESHTQYASDQITHQDYQDHTVSHNDSHPQHHIQNNAQDNFTSHYRQSNEKNSEQSSETANKQIDTRRIDFYPSSPAPNTDLHNVAMRSDPNITEHLDNANVSNCSRIFFLNSR